MITERLKLLHWRNPDKKTGLKMGIIRGLQGRFAFKGRETQQRFPTVLKGPSNISMSYPLNIKYQYDFGNVIKKSLHKFR